MEGGYTPTLTPRAEGDVKVKCSTMSKVVKVVIGPNQVGTVAGIAGFTEVNQAQGRAELNAENDQPEPVEFEVEASGVSKKGWQFYKLRVKGHETAILANVTNLKADGLMKNDKENGWYLAVPKIGWKCIRRDGVVVDMKFFS